MTEEKRDNALILILYLITTLILCVVSYNQALMKIENELKTGAIRVYDKRYICDYAGTYVSDERFIEAFKAYFNSDIYKKCNLDKKQNINKK